jgi:hypothetical protein
MQLLLAAVAAALCLLERTYRPAANAKPIVETELAATPRGAPWFLPFR